MPDNSFPVSAGAIPSTFYDASIAALSGNSQQALPANSARRYLLIQNNSAANTLGVNLSGGVAALGSAGTITLYPGGTIERAVGAVPTNEINVIGTAGQPVTINYA